jgi:hypothetical protein
VVLISVDMKHKEAVQSRATEFLGDGSRSVFRMKFWGGGGY